MCIYKALVARRLKKLRVRSECEHGTWMRYTQGIGAGLYRFDRHPHPTISHSNLATGLLRINLWQPTLPGAGQQSGTMGGSLRAKTQRVGHVKSESTNS